MGARFYPSGSLGTGDPALGRWLSPDVIVPNPTDPQTFNRYSWVLGNPLRYVDPTGFFTEEQLQEWYPDDWEDWKENYPDF
jgi:RHS repeat-associated protein